MPAATEATLFRWRGNVSSRRNRYPVAFCHSVLRMISLLLLPAMFHFSPVNMPRQLSSAADTGTTLTHLAPRLLVASEHMAAMFLYSEPLQQPAERTLLYGVGGSIPVAELFSEPAAAQASLWSAEPGAVLVMAAGALLTIGSLGWQVIRALRERVLLRHLVTRRQPSDRIMVEATNAWEISLDELYGAGETGFARKKDVLTGGKVMLSLRGAGISPEMSTRLAEYVGELLERGATLRSAHCRLGGDPVIYVSGAIVSDVASGTRYLRLQLRDDTNGLSEQALVKHIIAAQEQGDALPDSWQSIHRFFQRQLRQFAGVYELASVKSKSRSSFTFYPLFGNRAFVNVATTYEGAIADQISFSWYLPLHKTAVDVSRRNFLKRSAVTGVTIVATAGTVGIINMAARCIMSAGSEEDSFGPDKDSLRQLSLPQFVSRNLASLAAWLLELSVEGQEEDPDYLTMLLSALQGDEYWQKTLVSALQRMEDEQPGQKDWQWPSFSEIEQFAKDAAELCKMHIEAVMKKAEDDGRILKAHGVILAVARSIDPNVLFPRPSPRQEEQEKHEDPPLPYFPPPGYYLRHAGVETYAGAASVLAGVRGRTPDVASPRMKKIFAGLKTLDSSELGPYHGSVKQQRGDEEYPFTSTKLMMRALFAQEKLLENAIVLEAGSADGFISVVCEKLGAAQVYAVAEDAHRLEIARHTANLNNTLNIEHRQGDILREDFFFAQAPTVLILNQAAEMPEKLQVLMSTYPSIRHIFLVFSNVSFEDAGSRSGLDALVGKIQREGGRIIQEERKDGFYEEYTSYVIERPQLPENRISLDAAGFLRQIGFRDARQDGQVVRVDKHTPDGELLVFVVSPGAEYAYAVRRDVSYNEKGETVSYYLMELYSSIDEKEKKEGYCSMIFNYLPSRQQPGGAVKTAYLEGDGELALSVNHPGNGLGKILLQIALEEARAREFGRVVIPHAFRRAKPFYRRFGFKDVDPEYTHEMVLTFRGGQEEQGAAFSLEALCRRYGFGMVDLRYSVPRWVKSSAELSGKAAGSGRETMTVRNVVTRKRGLIEASI